MQEAGQGKIFASPLCLWNKFAGIKGNKGDFVPKKKYILVK